MEYFLIRYDSRVVIYKHKMFIRLATGQKGKEIKPGEILKLMAESPARF